MRSDTAIDYAVFQLSPRHSRCELFASRNGNTEKLASGLVKPFVTHLKVAQEQFALAAQSIKLEVDKHKHAETWFTKGTLERFVRFVSTPEVLELVNTFDAEMSQLEAARKIYSQGLGDHHSGGSGGDGSGVITAADATKRELLRAIDVRLSAVHQDLSATCARASAAGFNPETVSELRQFADHFGAHRLNVACSKYLSFCQKRPDLISAWKHDGDDQAVRASWGSDMSIDDPNEDQGWSQTNNRSHQFSLSKHNDNYQQLPQNTTDSKQHADQSKAFEAQQQKTSSAAQNVQDSNKDELKKDEDDDAPSPIQVSQPTRRLSVQDRINLFENKQKENSTSGGKPIVVGKSVELRRQSSDLTSAPVNMEKAVLRRWSGASDMSIDLGNDKKDSSTESPLCTPSSSTVSLAKGNVFLSSSDVKEKNCQKVASDTAGYGLIGRESQAGIANFSGKGEETLGQLNWKSQTASHDNSKSFAARVDEVTWDDQGVSKEVMQGTFDREKNDRHKDEELKFQNLGSSGKAEVSSTQNGSLKVGALDLNIEGGVRDKVEPVVSRKKSVPQAHFSGSQDPSSFSRELDGFIDSRESRDISNGANLSSHSYGGSVHCEVEEVNEKEQGYSEERPSRVEGFGVQRMVAPKMVPLGRNPGKKSQTSREESGSISENSKQTLSGKLVSKRERSAISPMVNLEQAQRVRPKGSQELNDELKMKANELEKLFAQHKLRVPADQSSSARRNKHVEMENEQERSLEYTKSVAVASPADQLAEKYTMPESSESSSSLGKFSTPRPTKMDSHEHGNALAKNLAGVSLSGDSRGKFYERYMNKRDTKLREEWDSKRVEKEAKLKAMQDTFERSRAEMTARFSTIDRQNSSSAAQRAERLRSFKFQTQREQHPIHSLQSEGDEDVPELLNFGEVSIGNIASMSSQGKKPPPNKSITSSTPRTVTQSSGKASNTISGRRRAPPSGNVLAQSVPNFSDLRKENTKPLSSVSKLSGRSQARSVARSKSAHEEVAPVKEEKVRRHRSLRKSSGGPAEFSDLSTLNVDSVALAPLRFEKEQTEHRLNEKLFNIADGKHFRKSSVVSETLNEEEYAELPFDAQGSVDMPKQDDEEELETIIMDDCTGETGSSQESDKLENSRFDNSDSRSQLDPVSVAELANAVPSIFHAPSAPQDSPGESPVSWNSPNHHPFSYPNETSDLDASVDYPVGSPTFWNSHLIGQTDDAARIRKKWGNAQKPFIVANATNSQSRKDMTKGFKRLLKFGRKSRGLDTAADWISATTSEGDDDTEDGRESANRSSEDLRKSRMGLLQGHPSDDGFNESDLLSEQVQAMRSSIPGPPSNFKLREDHMSGSSIKAPRSFFSLSNFRSKGSDSKPR